MPHRRYIATDKQCLDIVHKSGRFERVFGPTTMTLDTYAHESITVATIERFVASQGEYLVVQYKDGKKEHIRGPQEINYHPLTHEKISVHEALKLAANEAVVVYRRENYNVASTTSGAPP